MGLDLMVRLESKPGPAWPAWTGLLASHQLPVQIRMIDGELAFPDEIPGDAWKELRVGLPQGMFTLRREPDGIRVVTWGNAAGDALRAWKRITWALAKAADGQILSEAGPQTADEYAQSEDL